MICANGSSNLLLYYISLETPGIRPYCSCVRQVDGEQLAVSFSDIINRHKSTINSGQGHDVNKFKKEKKWDILTNSYLVLLYMNVEP